ADTALRCAIEVAGVPQTAPSGTASPDDTPDMFTVTLRLRVTDEAGRRGEARRTLYLHHDPDLRRGFPLGIAGSGEPSAFFVRLRGKARRPGQRDAGQQPLGGAPADGTIPAPRPHGHALPRRAVHHAPPRL